MTVFWIKKHIYKFWSFVILLSIMPLSSCVYDQEMAYLNDQNIALERRVTKLQESQKSIDARLSTELETKLDSIRSNQVEINVTVEQLKGEIKKLSGRVEENEHIIKRAVERDLGEQDVLQADLANLSQKMTELDMMVKHHHAHLGLKPLVGQEDQERESGAVEPGEAAIEREVIEEKKKPKDIELYDNSLAYFKEENFEDAIDGFKSFLNEYPKSDRADNAQFWIGECYMALKQYEQAILAYQDVIKKFPKGNKVPNALLRQAGAFLEIKDKTSSRLLLKKIIEKYPKSNEAETAQKKLKTLK